MALSGTKSSAGQAKEATLAKRSRVEDENDIDDDDNRNGQQQWQKEMIRVKRAKSRQAAVLLLSWDLEHEHSMNTTQELNDLQSVFESKYNFIVQKELLSVHKSEPPRYQLSSILNKFLAEYDRPGNLVIIYYGGHGMSSASGEELRLLGGNPSEDDSDSTELTWNDVEPMLYKLKTDLLLIFDCCFAGLVARHQRVWPASRSHFEFIASTAFDQPARGPKSQGSFTRAMIKALDELAKAKGFDTQTLVQKIMVSDDFRRTLQQPVVHECGKANSFRWLRIRPQEQRAPVGVDRHAGTEPSVEADDTVNFYLRLKYVFKQKPSNDDIKAMVERLEDMVKNDRLPVDDVVWEGLSKHTLQASSSTPDGRFEVSVSTEKPTARPQRTLTMLSMDSDLPSSSESTREAHVVLTSDESRASINGDAQ